MSSQTIYSELKEGDNKKLWAYAQELDGFRRKEKKEKDTQTSLDQIDFSDTESMRQALFTHLYKESDKGNAQASDKLGKYLGLEAEKQSLLIQLVDFQNAYEENNNSTTT